MEKKDDRKVVFRRIRGRIVPIAVGGAGVAIAADAARSDIVRVAKDGSYSVRKKYAVMPMAAAKGELQIGTTISSHNKFGMKRGHINFFKNVAGEGEVDWLGVKKAHRGQGISKKLVSDAAAEMKSTGITHISSHVVHERSAGLFGDKVKSRFWKSYRTAKDGGSFVKSISKKDALAAVANNKWKSKKGTAAIFRDVKIPSLRRNIKPFKSTGIKAKIALGVGLAGLGAYMFFKKAQEK